MIDWVSGELALGLGSLVKKYSVQVPRYTSYPTAVEFSTDFGASEWLSALEEDREIQSASVNPGQYSLYFHFPFCHSLCYFCACNKVISRDHSVVEPYLKALKTELELFGPHLPSEISISQIHWGGGTPNYLTPEQMQIIHKVTLDKFPRPQSNADVSVEIDPRTTTPEHVDVLAELGFNRISLGVQDFDVKVQQAVNRLQTYEQTTEVCHAARRRGFSGVNIDLIYGLPAQTEASFEQTLQKVLTLRPDRIALYGYAHVTWLTKVQRSLEKENLPSPEERIGIFLMALSALTQAGYRYIGLDHFALPEDSLSTALDDGSLNRNFMGYTTHRGVRILGFGVSAISTLPGAYAQNKKDLQDYQSTLANGRLATERGLSKTADDLLRGELIESILVRRRIDITEFEAKTGLSFFEIFKDQIPLLDDLEKDRLLTISSSEIKLTMVGCLFARNIARVFDAYIGQHKEQTRRVFSQAV